MIDKEMSRHYNERQIELYIRFDKPKLMQFLQVADNYSPFKAVDMCRDAGLYKELAFLYFKTGKTDEAI